jgi:hypothetical protein
MGAASAWSLAAARATCPIGLVALAGACWLGGPEAPAPKDSPARSLAAPPPPAPSPSPTPPATPAEPGALFDYLRAGSYIGFARAEEKVPTRGPHATRALAYFNPRLAESLRAGAETHPAGSAAVLEIYNVDDELAGWSVAVKTQSDSDEGRGWYWYENLNVGSGADPDFQGQGIGVCFGCHSVGRDFILTPWP